MLKWIKDSEQLQGVQKQRKDLLLLAFWGDFSEAAKRALAELKTFAQEYPSVPVWIIDVGKLPGIHRQFKVDRVPTVVAVEKGRATKSVEGVQSARFYALHLAGAAVSRTHEAGRRQVPRVTVYSGPGCPACGHAKAYLRRHGIAFRDVDIAQDPRAAETISRRSGRMAVPQIDVNGRLIVGFNRETLDRLLGIEPERDES